MIKLHSSYIFGKQISPGEVPFREGVYFEYGRFNPLYVPVGFNFKNNIISIASEAEDELWPYKFRQINYNDFANGKYADHLGDGTSFFTYSYAANNEDSFILDNKTGYLIYNHPTYRVAINRYNSFAELGCKVPINSNIGNLFNYICIRCRYVSSGVIANDDEIIFRPLKREGGSLYTTNKTVSSRILSQHLYEKDWVNLVIDNTREQEPIDFFNFYFVSRMQSYDIDVGDIPYKIEISKIWFTNIEPEGGI